MKASLQDIIDHVAAWKKNPIKDVVGGGNSLGHGGGGSMEERAVKEKAVAAMAAKTAAERTAAEEAAAAKVATETAAAAGKAADKPDSQLAAGSGASAVRTITAVCKIEGLAVLLDGLQLGEHCAALVAWCDEQGFESVAEIRELGVDHKIVMDMISSLKLKPAKAALLTGRLNG